MAIELELRKLRHGSKVATPESEAAPRSPHQNPKRPDATSDVRLADSPFFFFFDLRRFWQKREPIQPKRLPKQAEMGSGCHSSASCGVVRGEKKKKRKKKMRRHKNNGWKKNKGTYKRI